jgi:beta-glucosidase
MKLVTLALLVTSVALAQTNPPPVVVPTGLPFQDPDRPVAERVADLLGRLTLAEKAGQIEMETAAVPHLGIPSYSWWGEAIHGVARAGRATMFPQSIGLAATWDTNLMFRVATAISDEARAKFILNPVGRYHTLTFWAPAADLTRDPRWGRAQETYGEDPLLTARMAVAYIRGMQGADPRYLKTAAAAKHFGMHGQETGRTRRSFDGPERALWEYYFPPFRAAVQEGQVAGIMAAHSGINSMPCHMNRWLLGDVLRDLWGFEGVIFTDLHGTRNLQSQHQAVGTIEQAVAAVINAGVDVLDEWKLIQTNIVDSVRGGLLDEKKLDGAVSRALTQRFRLGLFDPPDRVPFTKTDTNVVGCAAHVALSRQAARASLVLLKNDRLLYRNTPTPLLPLDRRRLDSIAILGPYAEREYFGSYISDHSAQEPVSLIEGIQAAVGDRVVIRTARWFDADDERHRLATRPKPTDKAPRVIADEVRAELAANEAQLRSAALQAARQSDVVVLALGLTQKHEFEGKDRLDLGLPKDQADFAEQVIAANPNTVVVLFSGGPLAVPWLAQNAPAILQAWLPGEQGGQAIADVLFGDYNPAGRLPLTCYLSLAQVPRLEEYDITMGRTYLYLEERPLYPFGHGLSYTSFDYRQLRLDREIVGTNDTVQITFEVQNTGRRDGEEVVQLYIRDMHASLPVPVKQLRGFARVALPRGQSGTVTLPVAVNDLGLWDPATRSWRVEPGLFEVQVGASSADIRLCRQFQVE